MTNIKNDMGDSVRNTTDVKRIQRGCDKQLYANNVNHRQNG